MYDYAEILSARNFQSFMSESTQDIDATNWTPSFIARYLSSSYFNQSIFVIFLLRSRIYLYCVKSIVDYTLLPYLHFKCQHLYKLPVTINPMKEIERFQRISLAFVCLGTYFLLCVFKAFATTLVCSCGNNVCCHIF